MDKLTIQSLTYRYPSGQLITLPDIVLPQGENLLILGRSGSGKTTLLHLMAGILAPDSGEVGFGDTRFFMLSPAERDLFRGRNIGMIFQKNFFIDGISVRENLVAARRLAGNNADNQLIDKIVAQLGIAHLGRKSPRQLSEGEQQRFSIARALVNEPGWILADEPTSSLDDYHCNLFVDLMKNISFNRSASWLVATHDNRLKPHFSRIIQL